MTNIKYFILASLVIVLSAVHSFAQKRSIDIEPLLMSPEVGAEVVEGSAYPFLISIKNNGPDNLIVGDTLFVGILNNNRLIPVILKEPIPNGATVSVFETKMSYQSTETTPGDKPNNICIQSMEAEVDTIRIDGVRVELTYSDPNLSNNQVCNLIIIKRTPTALEDPDVSVSSALHIYPNPAVDEIYIRGRQAFSGRTQLRITNISGRQVLLKVNDEIGNSANNPLRLDVSSLSDGLYFIELKDGVRRDRGILTIQR